MAAMWVARKSMRTTSLLGDSTAGAAWAVVGLLIPELWKLLIRVPLIAVAAYALVHILFTLLTSRPAEVSCCCIFVRAPIRGKGCRRQARMMVGRRVSACNGATWAVASSISTRAGR